MSWLIEFGRAHPWALLASVPCTLAIALYLALALLPAPASYDAGAEDGHSYPPLRRPADR